MTQEEVVRIVVATAHGIIVSGTTSAHDHNTPGNTLLSRELKMLTLVPCVVTGVGLTWTQGEVTGVHFLPMFEQIQAGGEFIIGTDLYFNAARHFRYSGVDARQCRTDAAEMHLRVVTEHGLLHLPLGATTYQDYGGDLRFRLPEVPVAGPASSPRQP